MGIDSETRKSRKRRLIWGNHRSVAAFRVQCVNLCRLCEKSGWKADRRWRSPVLEFGHGPHRRIPNVTEASIVAIGTFTSPSDGGDDSRDRNFLKSLPLQVPAERQLWVACSDRPDSSATSKFAIRNDRLTCAPCQGGAFQWVQAPPGNRSSRKQPEQSWR